MIPPFAFLKGAGGPPPFDPATLALAGFFVGYTGASPWEGTASAGTSGSEDLTEATDPPANTGPIAEFDATLSQKLTGDALSDFFDADGWGIHLRIYIPSGQPADPGNGNRYTLGSILVDSGAYFGVFPHDSGISVECADGIGAASNVTLAVTEDAWISVQIRYNHAANGKIQIREGGGSWSEQTYGAIGDLSGLLRMGCNYDASAFATFQIKACLISDYAPDDTECTDVLSYLDTL